MKIVCSTYTRIRIHWHHGALLKVTSDLKQEQFNWRPGPKAPPIGWHLWQIARGPTVAACLSDAWRT